MGNFYAKCIICDKNNYKYELNIIKNIVYENPFISYLYMKQYPHCSINFYRYKCSNGHIFNSVKPLK